MALRRVTGLPRSEAGVGGSKDQCCHLSGLETELESEKGGESASFVPEETPGEESPSLPVLSPSTSNQPILSLASWTLLELA